MRQIMNKEPRYKEVVVDFVDRVHGTGFPEIRPWRPLIAIPVEIVDVVAGTDSSKKLLWILWTGYTVPVFLKSSPGGP